MSRKQMMTRLHFSNLLGISLGAVAALGMFGVGASTVMSAEAIPVDADPMVEWFAAEEAGQIEIKFIPKDATEAMVLVKNLTAKPLSIKLPEAFAAVPINAQGMMGGGMGGGGMGGGGMGGGGMGGGGQGMGGGMGGGGMGGDMGMMRVAPEKQLKVKVTTVCLEHGKPDPNPKMAYKMIPAEHFTSDARVIGVCKMLGYNMVTQNTAQAAAWHLTDNLSWQQLAAKNRSESKYTGNVAFFKPFELRQASSLVAEVTLRFGSKSSDSDSNGKPYYEESGYDGN